MEKQTKQNNEIKPFDIPEMDSARDRFCQRLSRTVRHEFSKAMEGVPDDDHELYRRSLLVTSKIQDLFAARLGSVPSEIRLACLSSEMIVAPSMLEKIRLLKAIVGIAGCVVGLGMILGAVGSVLGWGAGVLVAIKAWLVGVALTGPIALAVGGAALAAIAAYWALSGSAEENQQKFCEALDGSLQEAVKAIWDRCGDRLQAAK